MMLLSPTSTLFPYTTLFRSKRINLYEVHKLFHFQIDQKQDVYRGYFPYMPGKLLLKKYQESVDVPVRSEEHTSELQSRGHLVCRLLLEKKKKHKNWNI